MKRSLIPGGLLVCLLAAPAYAEIPDYVLDHEYQSCVGGDTDSARAAYCSCVREGMRKWDDKTFAEVALQATEAHASGNKGKAQVPEKLNELAQSCISQVLR
ncbi:MAG: hypothetical protein P4M13_00460 [Alphaproteobacteria bacterium]|nr:hypothetical protein [Alphaproteobacteria bacterium]